jgi:hypothetical protein
MGRCRHGCHRVTVAGFVAAPASDIEMLRLLGLAMPTRPALNQARPSFLIVDITQCSLANGLQIP